MTDKELIKREIERIEQILDDFNKTHNNTIDNGIVSAKKNICKHIKSFIDSLPEEPASKDLEEENPIEGEFPYTNPSDTLQGEIENIFEKLSINGIFTSTREGFSEVISHFVKWQHNKNNHENN